MESLGLQGEEAEAEAELEGKTTLNRSLVSANRSRQVASFIDAEDGMSDISVFPKLSLVQVIVSPPLYPQPLTSPAPNLSGNITDLSNI